MSNVNLPNSVFLLINTATYFHKPDKQHQVVSKKLSIQCAGNRATKK